VIVSSLMSCVRMRYRPLLIAVDGSALADLSAQLPVGTPFPTARGTATARVRSAARAAAGRGPPRGGAIALGDQAQPVGQLYELELDVAPPLRM
jgi:hypothetical protein